jgi:hypothetical protein
VHKRAGTFLKKRFIRKIVILFSNNFFLSEDEAQAYHNCAISIFLTAQYMVGHMRVCDKTVLVRTNISIMHASHQQGKPFHQIKSGSYPKSTVHCHLVVNPAFI